PRPGPGEPGAEHHTADREDRRERAGPEWNVIVRRGSAPKLSWGERKMSTSKQFGAMVVAVLFGAMLRPATAGIVLLVDDDRLECVGSQYSRIQDALNAAGVGDEVQVCPGIYTEQLTIKDRVTLRGKPIGTNRVIVRPGAMTTTSTSRLTGNAIAAGILVDTTTADIANIDLDLSDSDVAACSPILVGIYMRNASGTIEQVKVENVRVAPAPTCESGVGLYVELGNYGLPFGLSGSTKAIVSVRESRFYGYQKAG